LGVIEVITYVLLLLGTYLLSITWFGSITNFFLIPSQDWEEGHKKLALKKNLLVLTVTTVILLIICLTGWYLKGNLFFLFSGLVLFWNYFAEKRHIKLKQQQQNYLDKGGY
jgi:NAD/NADP transhydrogenase beta subunit